MKFISQWWQQPGRYDFLVAYLAERDMRRFIQTLMAAVTGALSTMPVFMLISPSGADGVTSRVLLAVTALVGVVMAGLWLIVYPTRKQSVGYVVTSALCIAVACVADADPLAAMVGATTFAMLGGYVAVFHSARLMLFNLVVASATTASLAVSVAHSHDVVLAVAKSVLILIAVIAVPVAVQGLVQYLGGEAIEARLDPLTGLLNRRSFPTVAADLFSDGHVVDGRRMCIIMADLDNFKNVNDTHGHAVGDQAIVAVAEALRHRLDGTSVIGRVGGEEFLIGARLTSQKARAMAESVREAIASTRFGITASVGVAVDARGRRGGVQLIEHLTARADRAMYSAKRRGGNQVAQLSGTEMADQPSPA